jgi:hypothetical protein
VCAPPLFRREKTMTRSSLTTKFTLKNIGDFTKAFRIKYKNETGETFKGNALIYNTIGVIQRKRVPDVEDVLVLTSLGNMGCAEDQALAIIERALNSEEYAERGLTGIFCDECIDLCIDVPINKNFKDIVLNMEENINKKSEARDKLKDIINKIKEASDNIDKEAVVEDDEQVNKNDVQVDNKVMNITEVLDKNN